MYLRKMDLLPLERLTIHHSTQQKEKMTAVCNRLSLWWRLLLLLLSVIPSTTSSNMGESNDDDVIDLDRDAATVKTSSKDNNGAVILCDTPSMVHDYTNVDYEYGMDDFIVAVIDNDDDDTCDDEDANKNHPATFTHHRRDVTGLQTWTSTNSLLADLYGGRLLLVILPTPVWCNNDDNNNYNKEEEDGRIRQLANEVADILDETFTSFSSSNQLIGGINLLFGGRHDQRIRRPLIGIMGTRSNDDGDVNDDDYDDARFINLMGNMTHYPAYKFIMTVTPPLPYELKSNNNNDATTDDDDDDDLYDSQIQSWDYIGRKESSIDIYESIMMYWYRTFLSYTLGNYSKPDESITRTDEEGHDIPNINNYVVIDDDDDNDNVKPPYYTFSSIENLLAFLHDHGEYILRPSKTTLRHQSQVSKIELEVFDYYMRSVDGDGTVDDVIDMYNDDNGLYVGTKIHNDISKAVLITDEIDPYFLVVQCRSKIDHNYDLSDNVTEQPILKENQLRATYEFDNLAMEMIHRKDVAFFALNATDKSGRIVCGGDDDDNGLFVDRGLLNNRVVFVRIPRYVDYTIEYDEQNKKKWHLIARNVRTDWDDINSILPRAMFKPATTEKLSEEKKEIHGKFASKDPMIPKHYIQTNLIAATVVHATPTVMWYDDKIISQLAFPWYRKVHAVLFVDMCLSHKVPPRLDDTNDILMNNRTSSWPASVHYTNVTRTLLYNQRLAIRMFYETARRHRKDLPDEDVVFLIVPSSETRIMTAFGIDIWTPLDEALFGGASFEGGGRNDDNARNSNGRCNIPFNVESQSILPIMMITDSSGRSGMQASRYYLCSDDILPSRSKTNKNAMTDFVESFFNDTIGKPFVRSDTTPTSTTQQAMRRKNINQPNVTILTGNTFESLVMDRHEEHTMLLMQANTCGHCKRFSIFWNELSSLVQVMNWSSVISVMKIDVTKNDVPHSKVNAWDLPSVYYFPANQKDEPIELPTPSSVSHNNHQYSYDEGLSGIKSGFDLLKWMIEQGKLDLDLLSRLDGSSTMDGEFADDSVN